MKVNQDNVEDIILFHKWIDFFNFTGGFLISLNPVQKNRISKEYAKASLQKFTGFEKFLEIDAL